MMTAHARILLIDPDDVFRYLAKAQLRSEGFEVMGASSATKGLSMALAAEPDLVMLAVGPDQRGLNVLREILTAEAWLPVIVLGRREDESVLARAVSMGAQDFLLKPIGIGGLGRFLADRLEGEPHSRAGRELVNWA